ncbi:hypothetical protein G5714_011667 [Onychostoma macrolepis]|uniref:Uncharacterized protein n=1 Tax=Onychostoma macrolepis TaxID=369639 RepID=A0A7J6CLC3_9TELE|nr:hypothetical protein G5714_011667 [Onychostoma macrolepis]
MDLIVFIAFPLLMEVQSHKSSPTVKVSPDVIRETPADVTVNQCYFITNREEKNIKVSSSCELDLSGAEVLGWAAVKSPGLLNITCYYTIQGIDKPSPHSPATVTVQVLTSTNTEQTTTTAMKTSLPVMSTSETITYSTTGFICLCCFTSSADVLSELNTSCQLETTSLLTFSVCSSRHE